MTPCYVHHRLTTEPRQWREVAEAICQAGAQRIAAANGLLYGIWQSQIGRPRDELTVMTVWSQAEAAAAASETLLHGIRSVRHCEGERMMPTLRPKVVEPPRRQGVFSFRWFETPSENWQEFLDLCAAAWPGFEAAYDSQIIGLWRSLQDTSEMRRTLLLTRRPNLAMWERSKSPEGKDEIEVRRKLSRRYDLCDWTCVYTATLLTAGNQDN